MLNENCEVCANGNGSDSMPFAGRLIRALNEPYTKDQRHSLVGKQRETTRSSDLQENACDLS